jgi:predicted O-methyltransferase YrrM
VSTAYIAGALDANGEGHLTSVDLEVARDRDPPAEQLLEQAGLASLVTLVHEPVSYNWYLYRAIREQTREPGLCDPCFDFCFIDGAHRWIDDALAFFLVDKLLRPGGWLLFDDLTWKVEALDVHETERAVAGVGEVYELLVAGHPAYDLLESDGDWGWARKSRTGDHQVRTVVKTDVLGGVRWAAKAARARLRR